MTTLSDEATSTMDGMVNFQNLSVHGCLWVWGPGGSISAGMTQLTEMPTTNWYTAMHELKRINGGTLYGMQW